MKTINNLTECLKYYSYSVNYSLEDDAYIAECIELGIMAHGETQENAITEIKEATRVHLLMLEEDGEEVPQPITLEKIKAANP